MFSYSVSFRHGWIQEFKWSPGILKHGILFLYFPPLVSTSFSGSFFLYADNNATGIFKLLLSVIALEERCDYLYLVLLLPSSLIDAVREYVYTSVFISVSGSIIENYLFALLHPIPTQQHRIYFYAFIFLIFGCTICGILVPQSGVKSPAVEAWNLNHQTAREVPPQSSF